MRKDVVREGSVLSNHFVHGSYALVRSGSSASNLRELVHKNHAQSGSTVPNIAISAMMWF